MRLSPESKLKVSIITVCLNAESTIEQSIKSVISQTYKNIEYIIIDGGSTDNTLNIINKYKNQIYYFISEKDNGIYDAMNKGLSKATGDFIYFLGADDNLTGDILTKIIPILKSNTQAIHYGQVELYPEGKLFGGKFNKWKLIHKNISHQSIFYPSDIIKKNNYNNYYKITADWDLNLYLMSRNYKFKYNGLVIATFNTKGISFQGDSAFEKDRRKIIKKYFGIKELAFLVIGIQIPILILDYFITKFNKLIKKIRYVTIYF